MKPGTVIPRPMYSPFFFHVGVRILAMADWYPARAGATAKVVRLEGEPGRWYAVVQWEYPFENFSPYPTSEIWPADCDYFEACP